MKKLLLTTSAVLGLATAMYGQGFTIDNGGNSNPSTAATSGGLVFAGGSRITQDFNLQVLAGSSSGSLSPLAGGTFLLSDSSATGIWSIFASPGNFNDPTFRTYTVPGVGAGGTAFFQIEAWLGNVNSYGAATQSGITGVFSQQVSNPGASPPITPPDFTSMPALVINVPEPTTLVLAGLGVASLLLFRRRK